MRTIEEIRNDIEKLMQEAKEPLAMLPCKYEEHICEDCCFFVYYCPKRGRM